MRPRARLTHWDARGQEHMVDVSAKAPTARTARAEGLVRLPRACVRLLASGGPKGDCLAVARLAGIQAAKRTPDLIPLCHPLPIEGVTVTATRRGGVVTVRAEVRTTGRTGVEMEALTAVGVACLTVYDMLKSASHGIVIGPIRLLEKHGGRSGSIVLGARRRRPA